MKILGLLFLVLATLGVETASAIPLKVLYQDIKLPTQRVLERQIWTAPIASNTARAKEEYAGATSAAVVTLSTFASQPDYPRNVSITPRGTTGDIENCVIVVNGTNIFSRTMSENITFQANDTGKQVGNKAFKTLTSVVFPLNCESGAFAARWDIGYENKFGLKKCMDYKGDFGWGHFGGTKETEPTCTASASTVESNVCTFQNAPDDGSVREAFFVQNNLCY